MNINEMHEANRKWWDVSSPDWKKLDEEYWRECAGNPSLAFEGNMLEIINEFVGDLKGKNVCLIGSGDNFAAFALAGLGADVTSTDISQPRLDIAKQRAGILGLDIRFVRCDATDISSIADDSYDLVCSTNGFFVWIADLSAVFASVNRVLKPGGFYIFYDVHPFQRPWKDQNNTVMEKPYYQTGPFSSGEPNKTIYYFHWTLSDIINSLLGSEMTLQRIAETPAVNSRFWEGPSYGNGNDQSLQDWHKNPRAGLPVWMTVAAQRPS